MPIDEHDLRHLRRALDLAQSAIGRSDPNPRVGCVIADSASHVIGEGSTQRAGDVHAEVMALRAAQAGGASPQGGTAWVSLEPCSHHGRTPPCCDALIAAGLRRVVVSTIDPNPLVAGAGVQRLRDAGIAVEVADGEVAGQARELNIGFFSRMRRRRPWVRCKVAASLDGHTALADGRSQWITGEAARVDGHAWRKRAGAVMTGAGTALADDPRLDVRHVSTDVQPLRVLLDSQLRVPASARVFAAPGHALVYCVRADGSLVDTLRARQVEVVKCAGADNSVNLPAVLDDLAARGINELHVEAGPTLNGALLEAGLIDELLVYLAPKVLGSGLGMLNTGPLADLELAWGFQFEDVQRVGDDLRVIARPRVALDWLN